MHKRADATGATFPLSTQDQVGLILDFFGFIKSELAKIAGVTRFALYAWLDGTSEPSRDNAERLRSLARIAFDLDPTPRRPLFHAYIERPQQGSQKSLVDALMDPGLEVESLRPMIDSIRRMTLERDRQFSEAIRASDVPSAESSRDGNLEDNLDFSH